MSKFCTNQASTDRFSQIKKMRGHKSDFSNFFQSRAKYCKDTQKLCLQLDVECKKNSRERLQRISQLLHSSSSPFKSFLASQRRIYMKKKDSKERTIKKISILKHLKCNTSNPAKPTKRCSRSGRNLDAMKRENPLIMLPYYSGSRIFSKKK